MQHTSLTQDKELNILLHGVPLCVVKYRSYKLLKKSGFNPPCTNQREAWSIHECTMECFINSTSWTSPTIASVSWMRRMSKLCYYRNQLTDGDRSRHFSRGSTFFNCPYKKYPVSPAQYALLPSYEERSSI